MLTKNLFMNFGMIIFNENMEIEQNYVLLLKDGLIHLIMMKMIKDLFR